MHCVYYIMSHVQFWVILDSFATPEGRATASTQQTQFLNFSDQEIL